MIPSTIQLCSTQLALLLFAHEAGYCRHNEHTNIMCLLHVVQINLKDINITVL